MIDFDQERGEFMKIECKKLLELVRDWFSFHEAACGLPAGVVNVRAWRQYSILENSMKLWIEIDIAANRDVGCDEGVPWIDERDPKGKPPTASWRAKPPLL
jgi:hypothetical protein